MLWTPIYANFDDGEGDAQKNAIFWSNPSNKCPKASFRFCSIKSLIFMLKKLVSQFNGRNYTDYYDSFGLFY